MFGLKIFIWVQTFRRVPPVLPFNFCHPADVILANNRTGNHPKVEFCFYWSRSCSLSPDLVRCKRPGLEAPWDGLEAQGTWRIWIFKWNYSKNEGNNALRVGAMLCDNLWQVSHWKILLRNLKLPTLLDSWPRTLCHSLGHYLFWWSWWTVNTLRRVRLD